MWMYNSDHSDSDNFGDESDTKFFAAIDPMSGLRCTGMCHSLDIVKSNIVCTKTCCQQIVLP